MGILKYLFATLSIVSYSETIQEKGIYFVKDIEEKTCLDKASLTEVTTFFNRRMENKLSKMIGNNWLILLETEEYVYYGKPNKNRKETYVYEFYKVERSELIKQFPGYASQDGLLLKPLVYDRTIQGQEVKFNQSCSEKINYKFKLLEKHISVIVSYEANCDESTMKKLTYRLLLNKDDLSTVQKELIIAPASASKP